MKADLARAIAQLMRQVINTLSMMLISHVQITVMLHCTVLPVSP